MKRHRALRFLRKAPLPDLPTGGYRCMNALRHDLEHLISLAENLGTSQADADPHRQKLHIQPPVGWLNDPNGLCKVDSTYHVFYQYSPFDPNGGVKHWGHVTSTDLLHWQQQPVILCPDEPFDCHGAYSGSALYEDGQLWLFYTGNIKHSGRYDYITAGRENNLCLAVSRDCRTLASKECLLHNAEYPAGLSCHVRDPKVWRQDGACYMVLGARTLEDKGEALVFASTDKRRWQHINTITTPEPFGYMWECPDLFQLDGQWFLLASPQGIPCQNAYGCGYFPLYGDFRGEYTLGDYRPLDSGFDYYAPQSFLDGDRRLQFGWMSMPDAPYTNPTVDYGWQHCLTFPRQLRRQGDILLQAPADELKTLRGEPAGLEAGGRTAVPPCFELAASPEGSFSLTIADGLTFSYDEASRAACLRFSSQELGAGRDQRTLTLDAPCRSVQVLADVSSLEIFLNGGAAVFSTRYYPAPGPRSLRLEGTSATLWPLSL